MIFLNNNSLIHLINSERMLTANTFNLLIEDDIIVIY